MQKVSLVDSQNNKIVNVGRHIFWELHEVRKAVGFLFFIVHFGCWLAGLANNDHTASKKHTFVISDPHQCCSRVDTDFGLVQLAPVLFCHCRNCWMPMKCSKITCLQLKKNMSLSWVMLHKSSPLETRRILTLHSRRRLVCPLLTLFFIWILWWLCGPLFTGLWIGIDTFLSSVSKNSNSKWSWFFYLFVHLGFWICAVCEQG